MDNVNSRYKYILSKNISVIPISLNVFEEVEKINNTIKNYEIQKNNKIKNDEQQFLNFNMNNLYNFETVEDDYHIPVPESPIIDLQIEDNPIKTEIIPIPQKNEDDVIIKKYSAKDELDYDNLTYQFTDVPNMKNTNNLFIPERIDENDEDNESMDDKKKLEKMDMLFNFDEKAESKDSLLRQFEEIYNNKTVLELNNNMFNDKNFDELKNKTNHFIENCIMNSVIKYDSTRKIYILNLSKLHKNILNYEDEENKNISIISTKKQHSFIIYYKNMGKWTELSCDGLKVIDEKNKFLKICIEKLKDKEKFRKNMKDIQLRGTKLNFLNEKFQELELYCISKINI